MTSQRSSVCRTNDQDMVMSASFGARRQSRNIELKRGIINDPAPGLELEYIVGLIKDLADAETQLDRCKERLVFRCNDFNNNVVVQLFDPSDHDGGNFYLNNVKRAFKTVGIEIDAATASLVVKRYDSNSDGELTYSDVLDIFNPKNPAVQKEIERRTVFKDPGQRPKPTRHMFEYVKDVLDLVEETVSLAEKISLSLIRRPTFTVAKALKTIKQRGATSVAIDEFKRILVCYRISGVEESERSDLKPRSSEPVHSKVNLVTTATPFNSTALAGEMLLYHRQLDDEVHEPDLTVADIQVKPSVFDTDRNLKDTFESPKVTLQKD